MSRAKNAPLSGFDMQVLMRVRHGQPVLSPTSTLTRLQALGLVRQEGDQLLLTEAGEERCQSQLAHPEAAIPPSRIPRA